MVKNCQVASTDIKKTSQGESIAQLFHLDIFYSIYITPDAFFIPARFHKPANGAANQPIVRRYVCVQVLDIGENRINNIRQDRSSTA
jgi:hypothetical protein